MIEHCFSLSIALPEQKIGAVRAFTFLLGFPIAQVCLYLNGMDSHDNFFTIP